MVIHNYNSKIYSGEIWTKSRCLEHEDFYNQKIFDCIQTTGFEPTDQPRIWKRGLQTIIVCLVDDIRSCSTDYHTDLPYLFDVNTTVITDNYLTCPGQYRVIRVPDSFFGIYSYQPEPQLWTPDRLFSFNINRVDYRRFHLLLDLFRRNYSDLSNGYVNFNCSKRIGPQELEDSIMWVRELWEQFSDQDKEKFQRAYTRLETLLPLKNYTIAFDLIPSKSWLNILVETYSSDNVISVSEKIFRALVTPAPWTVYSGRYTVAYLESLGFDCLSSIINHNHYDRLKEVEDKISVFNWFSFETINLLQSRTYESINRQCIRASQHNQQLLHTMKQRCPSDFDNWLDKLSNQLVI